VTITGSNLEGAQVLFGSSAVGTISDSATQITATSPAHPVSTVDVRVRTDNGLSATSAADRFSFSYTVVILGDSPSIYYRFGESSGTAAVDSSGNGHEASYSTTGITFGGYGAIAGDPDPSVAFAGGTGIVQETSDAGVPLSDSSRSVECWFKTMWPDSMWLAAWGPPNPGTGEFFGVQIFGGNRVNVRLGGATYRLPLIPQPGNFADGFWHQLVLTYDPATRTLTAYIDAQVLASQVIQQPLNTLAGALKIGNLDPTANGNGAFTGSLDELAIYSTVLSPAQIASHYKAAIGR